MDKIRIKGGTPLRGDIITSGAKNSALPCIAASLLSSETLELSNVPRMVRDVSTITTLLEHLGSQISWQGDVFHLQADGIDSYEAPYDMVKTMRASVLVLGPLVSRFGKAVVSLPGGCAIGARPIDMHLKGLEALGARIRIEHGYVLAACKKLRGAQYRFPAITVTGTENLILAAVLAEGETILENCALEPEVGDLIHLLQKMGASITGEGTSRIQIQGVSSLHGASHSIVPDRIEAGTFLLAGAITRGNITVRKCTPGHLTALLQQLDRIGCTVSCSEDSISLQTPEALSAADIETREYPGFPTDLQAQYMAVMTQARGVSQIHENIFENRFMHVGELQRMRAAIKIHGHVAEVTGGTPLSGATVMATDLRASACLLLAGLIANGVTVIQRVYHIDRGYERIEEKLRGVGAEIERIR